MRRRFCLNQSQDPTHLRFNTPAELFSPLSNREAAATKKPTMKLIVAFAAIVAVALAAPQGRQQNPDEQVVVVKETPSDNIGLDGYNFGYELSNGGSRQESAQLVNAGTEHESLNVSGSFSYVDPVTGHRYVVTYTADENGFHPQGEHIPA